jgi:DNA repair protein REV1
MRRKKLKLQNLDAELRSHSTDKPQIFRGIVAHVNGYTQPSLNDLHKLIVQYGGGFQQYLDGKTMVTHIIASNLTPKKAVEFKRYRIVKPAWIVESVKAGKLLPWDQFRVLDEGAGQRVLGFTDGRVVNEVSTQKRGYKDQTDTSWYTEQLKGTPRASERQVFRSQIRTPDRTDSVEEIEEDDEPPPSTQLRPPTSHTLHNRNLQGSTLQSPKSSPPVPHDTPQLIRDLRSFAPNDIDAPEDETPEREPSPLARKGQVESSAGSNSMSGLDPTPEAPAQPEQNREAGLELNPEAQDAEQTEQIALDNGKKRLSEEPELLPPPKRTKLTAEEHNKILLQDPHIWKSSVVNPDFLEQYYRESRLHHLSTWKADLKSQLQAMAEEKSASQKHRQKRDPKARRYIMHVDFDSFFAAVSLKKAPQYKDVPAVVAHGSGSGSEIASCNYPARKFGITNGMWMRRAQELCPDVKILPYDFPAYEEASRAFYEAIIATGGLVQSVSVDEALVDISTLCFAATGGDGIKRHEGTVYREQEAADKIATKLRAEVKEKTECDVSIGIGGNILQAKVALRKAKPAGQFQLRPEDVLDFMGTLEVTSLPGVAYSIGGKLEEMGIKLVKDIREFTKEKMMSTLGPKTGEKLWEYARGIDRKEVGDVEVRKSVSAEVNWGVRFYDQEQVDEFILNLCGELTKRLIKERVKGKQLSLKIMKRSADSPLEPPKHMGHGKCDTFNKSVLLGVATNTCEVLTKETLSMLKSLGISPGELRGIGVQMTRLEPLKASTAGQQESSQRRLQFKIGEPRKPLDKVVEEQQEDPIEDNVTPKKPKAPPDKILFGPPELNKDSPSRKPLNTLGTQFILPSQVDPAVLAELPDDIRTKLAKHMQSNKTMPTVKSKEKAPQATPKVFTALPAESQIDQDMLNSLPEEVRSEVMAFYNKSPSKVRNGDQAILPQSPRKNRTVAPGKRPIPPPVRRRGRPSKFDVRSHANGGTLTQSNFIAGRMSRQGSPADGTTTDTDGDDAGSSAAVEAGMDAEFLAALPEDIRREVLDEQRRKRLAKTAGIQVSARRKQTAAKVTTHGPIERLLKLPPRPPKPSFTGRKLTSLPELREAISEWAQEFRGEGPYREDTEALCKYIGRVVGEEGDMAKAVGAVKWLGWVVEEELCEEGDAREKWAEALQMVKEDVQRAVKERGLGGVKL